MRFLRFLWLFALVNLCVGVVWGQPPELYASIPLISDYDNDTVGSYIYCNTLGTGQRSKGDWIPVPIRVKTVGSSATVSAQTAGQNPFANVAVGDELVFFVPGTSPAGTDLVRGQRTFRYVATRADADTITVAGTTTNIDLSIPTGGWTFAYRTRSCGTTSADGWVDGSESSTWEWSVQIDQSDAGGGVKTTIECEVYGASSLPQTVYTRTTTTYPDRFTLSIAGLSYNRCRLGTQLVTSDPSDAGGNLEKISAYLRLLK